MLKRLIEDEAGATIVEYTLIAAMISLACIVAFQALGLNLAGVFTTVTDTLAAAIGI